VTQRCQVVARGDAAPSDAGRLERPLVQSFVATLAEGGFDARPDQEPEVRVLLTSSRAERRLARASELLRAWPQALPATLLAASPETASELVRSLGRPVFGWRRLTLFRLASELARPGLLEAGLALAPPLSQEALWERVVFQLGEAGQLGRLEALRGRPGLAQALARTVGELRALGSDASGLEAPLPAVAAAYQAELAATRLVDRADVLRLALAAPPPSGPLLVLDVTPAPGLETELLTRLARHATQVVATVPRADERGVAALSLALGVAPEHLDATPRTALEALQQGLFSARRRGPDFTVEDFFSAPGEARECVEIARRLLDAARQGVPFERMAVLVRAPAAYRAPLEEALRRAGVPAHFAQGLPTPDPGGRSLLALLRCADEGLSARRFAEYLSLGQVPSADPAGAPPPAAPSAERYQPSGEDTLLPPSSAAPVVEPGTDGAEDPDAPVAHGRLRAPRRWEQLLIDAAVIGGVDRWRRRLHGLEQLTRKGLEAPSLSEAHRRRADRQLADLSALTHFALPLLDALQALPAQATWGVWLEALGSLATRALQRPQRVLAVLQDLAPMAEVGPVSLRTVATVLRPRLGEVTEAPPTRRGGQVLVAPVALARGLSFELVFIPGLAERLFPQKVREDPLLPDERRSSLDPRLETQPDRVAQERLALGLAVGAASRRAVLSWPRVDAEHARPRVPSFYALEAARAVEGTLPSYEVVQRRAEQTGQARLAWPAPADPTAAIDASEFDLAVLEGLFQARGPVRGRARYLIDANRHLARALRARHGRWSPRWTAADGLVLPSAAGRAALAPHQLDARPFSPTALELHAACPYRFFLSTVHRLSPLEIPGELEELGPLEKGSMTHEVQFQLLTSLRAEGRAVTLASLEGGVFARLEEVLTQVTTAYADDFVPAIERVWADGLEVLRADLREWLRRMAGEGDWAPAYFELGFGLPTRDAADPASVSAPVGLDGGLSLRGSIDLVERSVRGTLRATDYKTGKARAGQGNVVGGGRHLQPVLYALVLERLFPELRVEGGRLFYCTQAGGFSSVATPLEPLARAHLAQVVLAIRAGLEQGFFPADPAPGECQWCDFAPVCGPDEERRLRVTRKARDASSRALQAVRGLP
jgi:CRISPR/Cas system-associated exonuclease Cas4 (RecB family)